MTLEVRSKDYNFNVHKDDEVTLFLLDAWGSKNPITLIGDEKGGTMVIPATTSKNLVSMKGRLTLPPGEEALVLNYYNSEWRTVKIQGK
ncbi:MAG: hypothetical protein UX87_C0019G0055 [Candidatus Amesbacteria bacterium GW2011_GWA1_47_16]|uniref:Uncharacterized protein n=4 Tax=Candidatus Amesiibacteriota TaxID=1752730 RepID=A0A0G1S582_9BACT|nr:MAG: hypothetical protein UX87_C0019G0055 [Candidatus Amesbacteria bacterium GW2011_GWA1_47_16]KKU64639.1 MAG: hypothetical protein UX86_C0006G0007 [Candidatus Amesbacteria bacterium GW2011_GWC1_47_15]KKU96564.1 MAG: hypothetical protein UY28_C0032G0006 [Candidatus Amesbacteria bacterium GW2011_GWB1_48_13]OGD00267.1 MAG: hypothetical protein A2701_02250 [Candidatus Amesbacteria bacterium RIFCSPHIGHO2_01_FULL_47_34]OGD01701.1 MAG: hypothetical protein A2972_00210 [Candidatus Amesbacteria bact